MQGAIRVTPDILVLRDFEQDKGGALPSRLIFSLRVQIAFWFYLFLYEINRMIIKGFARYILRPSNFFNWLMLGASHPPNALACSLGVPIERPVISSIAQASPAGSALTS